MKQKIALAGVPNCGKTTFWNLATGRCEKTGNWPGVTTEKLSAPLKLFPDVELIDLPGIYSLSEKSLEEISAIDFLKNRKADSLIIIIDGTKPEQSIYLAIELLSLGIPAVLGINFADELRAQNIFVDINGLSNALSAPVILISAAKNENIPTLLNAAKNIIQAKQNHSFSSAPKKRHAEASFLAKKYFIHKSNAQKDDPKILARTFLAFLVLISVFLFANFVLNNYVQSFFEHFTAIASALMNYFHFSSVLKSFFIEGILSGIALVASFIPELMSLFIVMSFLESSGYMARFAFLSDYLLKKIGLSGRSMIPLLLGFGCTVPAIYAAKSSDSEAARSRTLSMLMFIPCSAKLPLTMLICETIFPKLGSISVFLFYILIIAVGAAFSFWQNRETNTSFILEIPKIRVPSVKSILKTAARRIGAFITKASGIVVLTGVLIWVLKNFSIYFEPVELQSESALACIGNFLVPFFAPTGIPYEGALALFCGLFSKESALFTLDMLNNNISELFPPISAVSFLLFFLIYSPCFACLSAVRQEFGAKKAILLSCRQIALAYFISFAFYQFALFFQNIFSP